MMVLVVSASHTLCARKLNSSVLLLSSHRKLLQFWVVLVVPVTLRLIPRPPSGSLSGRVSPDCDCDFQINLSDLTGDE